MRPFWLLVLIALCVAIPLRAVEDSGSNGSGGDGYFNLGNTVDPIAGQVGGWDTGWGNVAPGVTGWNYVGLINVPDGYLSGVYLGNGWVLTAAHGGNVLNNFVLNGITYTPTTGSSFQPITLTTYNDGTGGQADLLMFKLPASATLPQTSLALANSVPIGYDATTSTLGSDTVIVGNGFPISYPGVESWGTGSVYQTDGLFSINSEATPFQLLTSIDYDIFTLNSGVDGSANNNYNLYPGDSGGADFILVNGTWQLAGINEFEGTNTSGIPEVSGFVQVDDYLPQINAIMAPEPSTWMLLVGGLGMLIFFRRHIRR